MKYFVITDSTDTQVGLRLAGIEGVVVREEAEVRQAVELAADQIAPLKLTAQRPLVVEIPDRHSAGRSSDSITRYIREAIGVKI